MPYKQFRKPHPGEKYDDFLKAFVDHVGEQIEIHLAETEARHRVWHRAEREHLESSQPSEWQAPMFAVVLGALIVAIVVGINALVAP